MTNPFLFHILVFTINSFAIAAIYWLSRIEKTESATTYVYSKAYKIVNILLCILIPLILTEVYVDSNFRSGIGSGVYVMITSLLYVLLIYSFILAYTTQIEISNDNFMSFKTLFTEKSFMISDICKVQESEWQPEYIVILRDGSKIRISQFVTDSDNIIKHIRPHLAGRI